MPNGQPSYAVNPDADNDLEQANYAIFRDCVSASLIAHAAPAPERKRTNRARTGRKGTIKPVPTATSTLDLDATAAEDLADFAAYLSAEIFSALPVELRTLTYASLQASPNLQELYTPPLSSDTLTCLCVPLPASVTDSLLAYKLLPTGTNTDDPLPDFLAPILDAYLTSTTAAPPPALPYSQTRALAVGCEICGRDWIPLTYHHLIPRGVHEKVRRRGWHPEEVLNSVAWLCRACHSFVHGIAGNEELAREWFTVERLLGRDDVQRWAAWIGKVRWKKR